MLSSPSQPGLAGSRDCCDAAMLRVLHKAESFVCWRKAGLQLAPATCERQ